MSSTLAVHGPKRRAGSTLPKDEARRRYVEIGELAVLEQIKRDSEALDRSRPVGPFARLDANAVAAHDGKTRGAITNLFGSQAAFQAETMALALSVGDWIELIEYPRAADLPDAGAWLDAFFGGESARGPQHGGDPVDYATLWALWLSTVPYGLWSEHVRGRAWRSTRSGSRGSSASSAARSSTSDWGCARGTLATSPARPRA